MVLHQLVEFTTVESTVVLRQPRPRFFPSRSTTNDGTGLFIDGILVAIQPHDIEFNVIDVWNFPKIDEESVNQHQSTVRIDDSPGAAVRVMPGPNQSVAPQLWKVWKDRACYGYTTGVAAGGCSPSASAAPSASMTARTPGTLRRSR